MKQTIILVISFLTVLFAQAQVFAASECSSENVVFCNGFDSESELYEWQAYKPELVTDNPGPFNVSGNKVLRLRVPSGCADCGVEVKKIFSGAGYDKLYSRMYVKWEVGYNFNAPVHGPGPKFYAGKYNLLYKSGSQPSDLYNFFRTTLDTYYGKLKFYTYFRGMDCGSTTCYGDHFPSGNTTPQLETGRWYCLEAMIDEGTAVDSNSEADGMQTFWIDGVEYGPFNNLWFRTDSSLKINIFQLSLYHHDSTHSDEGLLIDDVVVSTERIGPADGSLPSIPNGFSVRN